MEKCFKFINRLYSECTAERMLKYLLDDILECLFSDYSDAHQKPGDVGDAFNIWELPRKRSILTFIGLPWLIYLMFTKDNIISAYRNMAEYFTMSNAPSLQGKFDIKRSITDLQGKMEQNIQERTDRGAPYREPIVKEDVPGDIDASDTALVAKTWPWNKAPLGWMGTEPEPES